MPQGSVTGSVPISKSQLRKTRKKPSAPLYGKAICSSCGQQCASATIGNTHLTCNGFTEAFFQRTKTDKLPNGLKNRMVGQAGVWTSLAEYQEAKRDYEQGVCAAQKFAQLMLLLHS